MSKLVNRLLIFFIGVPVCIALCFINFLNFLPLRIICVVFSCVASLEFSNIIGKKIQIQNQYFSMILSLSIMLATTLQDYLCYKSEVINLIIFLTIFLCFLYEIFSKKSSETNFSNSIERICSTLLILLYTGYFFSFLIKMTSKNWFIQYQFTDSMMNSIYFTLFLIIVFGTDSFAWFFGMTMGKNNRGYIKASPNKSIAGFVGGIIATVIVVLLITRHIPIFNKYFLHISNLEIIIITLITSTFAIIGDLIESVLKRCSNVKDSGTIIPGRGGVLDSIDSILLTAPVFYLLVKLF